jgi:hypothetical protein
VRQLPANHWRIPPAASLLWPKRCYAVPLREGKTLTLSLIRHDLAENGTDMEVNPPVDLIGRQGSTHHRRESSSPHSARVNGTATRCSARNQT